MEEKTRYKLKFDRNNDPTKINGDIGRLVMKINKICPKEMDIGSLEESLMKQMKVCEDAENEIQRLLHECAVMTNEHMAYVDESVDLLDEIASDIIQLKSECDDANPFLNDTTKELWELHNAKNNLAHTIKTLNLISVLNDSAEKLSELVSNSEYKIIESLILGYNSVADCLQEFSGIEQFDDALRKYSKIKEDILIQVMKDVKFLISTYFDNAEMDDVKIDGYHACKVLELFGDKPVNEIINFYVDFIISEFNQAFLPHDKKSQLENVDRRFSWFKRKLLRYDQIFKSIFPAGWFVDLKMTTRFYELNEAQLKELLEKNENKLESKLLLYVIQKCLVFNEFCISRFPSNKGSFLDLADTSNNINKDSPTEYTSETSSQLSKNTGDSSNMNSHHPSHLFDNYFGDIFKPFLYIYIKDQSRALDEILVKFHSQIKSQGNSLAGYLGIKDNITPNISDPLSVNRAKLSKINYIVFPSAGELFLFFKHCFMQCSQFNSNDCLFQLVEVFKNYINNYLNSLIIPYTLPLFKESLFAGISSKQFESNDPSLMAIIPENISTVGCAVCTLEYCIDTITQLESKIKSVISTEYVSKVDFGAESLNYNKFLNRVINEKIVGDLIKTCKPTIQSIQNIKWDSISQVGDHSPYVSHLASKLTQVIPFVRNVFEASRKIYMVICTNFAKDIIKLYDEIVFKCHPISQPGTEQILLDLHLLKTILQSLPTMGTNAGRKISQSYIEAVMCDIRSIELDLKMVSSPLDPIEDFIIRFMSIIRDNSSERLKKIIQMKNVKGDRVTKIINIYNDIKPKQTTDLSPCKEGRKTTNLNDVSVSADNNENKTEIPLQAVPEGNRTVPLSDPCDAGSNPKSVYDIIIKLRELIK